MTLKKIQLQEENVEDIEKSLPVLKLKRKKRYPGGKIFAPELISQTLIDFVNDENFKLLEFTDNDIENEWNQFSNGLI
jgi:hypothetical protein